MDATSVLAADAEQGDSLQEIVVTATRREESLSRVPISVAAFTQQQMDVQGLEVEVLKGSTESMKDGVIRTFLIGTHGRMIGVPLHQECRDLLQAAGYTIEIDQPNTKEQPDGILVARK